MEKYEIIASVERERLAALAPQHADVIIEHICVGTTNRAYSYTADVSSTMDGGWISGGGSRTSYSRVFDVGFAVVNKARFPMRVQMVLAKVDEEGYVTDTLAICEDISPNEKRRLWGHLGLTDRKDLQHYMLKEIGIAVTPAQGKATYEVATYPGKRLNEVFGATLNAMPNSTMLDSMNLSIKSQAKVREVATRGLGMYLTYIKWATIFMVAVFLLGIVVTMLAYFFKS